MTFLVVRYGRIDRLFGDAVYVFEKIYAGSF